MNINDRKPNCDDPLMLWAVRESDPKRFVYVGTLTAKENGAACGCLCRGCGERLLAINTDKPPSHFERRGTKRRHFKHRTTAAADSRCLSKIARLLALQVFVEQQVVYLPSRERKVNRLLPNGSSLVADLSNAPETIGVSSRTWIDDFSAVLVLEDGRELLVTIRARHTLDAEINSTCVLSLAGINDPMIASWDTEKILAHLRAPQNGAEWSRHWDDNERFAMTEDALAQQHALLLGDIPSEWLEGLDGKQFGETILHYLIKKAVAERGAIQVPAYRVPVTRRMPDGEMAEEMAHWPACTLVLQEVRLEKRLGSMVPDVMCRATVQGERFAPFELMIEGAVTHLVDSEKRKKIVDANVACIEIIASFFDRVGQVPAAEIEELVCSSTAAKQWIYLPQAHRAAEKRLDMRAIAIERRQKEEARRRIQEEKEREDRERKEALETQRVNQWLTKSTDTALVAGYVKILKSLWSDSSTYVDGYKAKYHTSLVDELRKRLILTEHSAHVESVTGILRTLVTARDGFWETTGEGSMRALGFAAQGGNNARYAVDLMFALAKRRGEMSAAQRQAYKDYCALVRKEVAQENPKFRRDEGLLKLHALIIPALGTSRESELASPRHYAQMKNAREAAERQAVTRQKRLAAVNAGRLKQERASLDHAIRGAIQVASSSLRWQIFPFESPTSTVLLTRYNQTRPADMRFVDLSAQELIQTAEKFRKSAASIEAALSAVKFAAVEDVHMAARALVHAGLCTRNTK